MITLLDNFFENITKAAQKEPKTKETAEACHLQDLVFPFGRRVSSLAGGEKRDSEEPHLLKTVASGGPWHSCEQGEEALLPGSKIGPKCRRLAWAEAPVASRGAK